MSFGHTKSSLKSILLLCTLFSVRAFADGTGTASLRTTAPPGCLKLKTDSDFPSADVWKAALPGVLVERRNTPSPDYRFRVKSIEDVQKAVKFAKANNIRVSIIASGHEFSGRSWATSGLLIDVSLLSGIRVLESFEPTTKGAESVIGAKTNVINPKPDKQAAVSIAAGTSTQVLNDAISASKLFTHGAGHGSVSVTGGWGQFGGHGPFTLQHGLGVDQWLEAKIVTADGELKVVNKVSNPDLFWAIRGGGAGAWGVIVEATIKAYPDLPITEFTWWINSTASPGFFGIGATTQGFKDAQNYFLGELPGLQERNITGYFYARTNNIRGVAIHPGNIYDTAKTQSVWKPILEKLQSFPTMTKFQSKTWTFKNYKEYYDTTFGAIDSMGKMNMMKRHEPVEASNVPTSPGLLGMDSHLLGPSHLKSPNIQKAFQSMYDNWGVFMVAPGKWVGNRADTSVHPAWRNATAHIVGFRAAGLTSVDGLRELAPEMGAYGNEAHYEEDNWQRTFWGENYQRLSEVKRKYDPDNFFWVSPGINADQKRVVDGRLCKVENPITTSRLAPPTDYRVIIDALRAEALFGKYEVIGDFPKPGELLGMN